MSGGYVFKMNIPTSVFRFRFTLEYFLLKEVSLRLTEVCWKFEKF